MYAFMPQIKLVSLGHRLEPSLPQVNPSCSQQAFKALPGYHPAFKEFSILRGKQTGTQVTATVQINEGNTGAGIGTERRTGRG